ncbi:50S ribosomal protein L9 [Candidatus Manganitrophus noduliformans]|uniref:Large ribosomal subunit protein bL9 n=1 Tax=Candidatus Manganitrophus noduliformans TaxID=2606439 RepID=A0A7X6DRA0_9BACT|nr:50S ribosomal protein L9 [Candidatus Manganitrophus noduliformans]NKE71719.1 50S ribosomal protein L9 [Candidatus Manganitrophus noduliformans]
MKVILREDVDKLGRMGDLVNVADGYARNFLLPRNMAALATTKNIKSLEHEKRVIADRIKKEKTAAEEEAKKISAVSVSIPVQVGEEGKLFGSVTSKDIADAIAAQGFEIDKRRIQLEKPIKEIGTFMVPVKVHHDVTAQVKVEVIKSEAVETEG